MSATSRSPRLKDLPQNCCVPWGSLESPFMKRPFNPLATRHTARAVSLAVGLAAGPTAALVRAQTVEGKADAPIVLSPFEVNTDQDRGFVAASSLAGGRLAGDLKDTPVAYSVLT